jgi:cytochrome b561
MASWERLLARLTHFAFYALLLAIPLLGWASVSAAGAPAVPLYDTVPWPNLPLPRSEDLAETLGDLHGTLVKSVYVLLFLHVAGALKHHFLDKDEVLSRMLPVVRPRR